jgi:hypothetical protein
MAKASHRRANGERKNRKAGVWSVIGKPFPVAETVVSALIGMVAGANVRMKHATLPGACQHEFCNRGVFVITPAQCRAARALIEWSREDLAAAAKVAARTVVDFERGARNPIHSTMAAIRAALEAAGVIFVEENGEGPGVRLRKARQS